MFKNIDWIWFGIGIVFALFILPMLTGMVGNFRNRATTTVKRTA